MLSPALCVMMCMTSWEAVPRASLPPPSTSRVPRSVKACPSVISSLPIEALLGGRASSISLVLLYMVTRIGSWRAASPMTGRIFSSVSLITLRMLSARDFTGPL